MATVLVMPSREVSPEPLPGFVSQSELQAIKVMRANIELAKAALAEAEQHALSTIENGGFVEKGRFAAYVDVEPGKRSVSWKNVVKRLKGEGYCNLVLTHTKPGPDAKKLVVE